LKGKKSIKKRYDELGSSLYDLRYTEEQETKYALILSELPSVEMLLDNGCGTGLIFPKLDCTLVGLDLSSVLLEKARERLKENHYLVQGDSENLPIRDLLFDAVISITVIQNLSEPSQLISESIRVSRVGSYVIISSLKRVYNREEITQLVKNDLLSIKKVFTREDVNDWIIVSTKNQ
jgi:ubiquinone/menaquinone biosynthesis C-methylase UbiE